MHAFLFVILPSVTESLSKFVLLLSEEILFAKIETHGVLKEIEENCIPRILTHFRLKFTLSDYFQPFLSALI